jgi:hypothetical protein
MKEMLRNTYSVTTSTGNWLGYALRREHSTWGFTYRGCVLVLPSSDEKMTGAYVASELEWDFYKYQSRGVPYVSISSVIGVGNDFGKVKDTFPSELPEAYRGGDE